MDRPAQKRNKHLIGFGLATLGSIAAVWTLAARDGPVTSIDWQTLSNVGQAFGTVSAFLSAIALIGVGVSLRYERQQARIAQNDTIRSLRTELLEFAIENPQYLRIWGFNSEDGVEEAQYAAYISLFFSYSKMSFDLNVLTEYELMQWCEIVFNDPDIVLFWKNARGVYRSGNRSAKELRFAAIVDLEYLKKEQAALNRQDLVRIGPFLQTRKGAVRPAPGQPAPRRPARGQPGFGIVAVLVTSLAGVVVYTLYRRHHPASMPIFDQGLRKAEDFTA